MMGFQSLANSINTYFQTVADAYGYTARYDNDPRGTPKKGLWCEVLLDFGDSQQKEIGINSYREIGNLTVRIKQDFDLGISDLLIAADRIASAFRSTDVNSIIIFKVPRITKNGRVDDKYQVTVTCPFHYDEVSFVGNSFASLFDTPADFTDSGGAFVKVKDDESGLEFDDSDVGVLTLRPELNVDEIKKTLKPTQVDVGVFHGYSMPVYDDDNEELHFRQMIPGRWNGTSDIHFHITVAIADAEDVNDKFKFQLRWNKVGHTGIVPITVSSIIHETTILTGRNSQYDLYDLDFEIPYANISVDELFGAHLRRIAASGSEVSNEILIMCWHMDFTTNKIFGTGTV